MNEELPDRLEIKRGDGSGFDGRGTLASASRALERKRRERAGMTPLAISDSYAPQKRDLPFKEIQFSALQPGDCKWPEGGFGEPIKFCGHPKGSKSVYCDAHHRIAYNPPVSK